MLGLVVIEIVTIVTSYCKKR